MEGLTPLLSSFVAVSAILLVVCYRLDNTSPDISWTIPSTVLWAGIDISLGIVTACLPSLRPIFLLIRTGSAKQPTAKKFARFRRYLCIEKPGGCCLLWQRPWRETVLRIGPGEEHHPFSNIRDDKNNVDREENADDPKSQEADTEFEVVQPPEDKIIVREEICVNYSHVWYTATIGRRVGEIEVHIAKRDG